jgi:hypothetical protein
MKRNLYYHIVFGRSNALKVAILTFFLAIASWPRLLIEVFLRKSFGERYFSFATGIFVAIVLALFPLVKYKITALTGTDVSGSEFVAHYATWYLYLIAFVYMCIQRQKEIEREPSVFDFARFSLSTGKVNQKFRDIVINGKPADFRTISTLLEPCVFLAAGVVLICVGQVLGVLLFICSVCYSFSYFGAFYLGDQFVMDKIDEMICNEELVDSFVEEKQPEETRGFYAYGKRPNDPEFRSKVADTFIVRDEFEDVN